MVVGLRDLGYPHCTSRGEYRGGANPSNNECQFLSQVLVFIPETHSNQTLSPTKTMALCLIQFISFNDRDLNRQRPIGPIENTIEAGVAAAFAAAITNPLDAAKSRTQASLLPKVRGGGMLTLMLMTLMLSRETLPCFVFSSELNPHIVAQTSCHRQIPKRKCAFFQGSNMCSFLAKQW